MAYDLSLAKRIREILESIPDVEEKEMMGGLTFMVNGKMCVGIIKDELMCRVDPEVHETLVEKNGCRTMDFTHRPMKGYLLIESQAIKTKSALKEWMGWALAFNPKAKSSKKTVK